MIRKYLPKSTEDLISWYEKFISPLSLIAGLLVDNYILLKRVDLLEGNLLLISYLVIAGGGIMLINLIESGRLQYTYTLKIAPFIPVVVQFAFGGLLSGFVTLYSRSAAFAVSWIFIFALAALMVGNERFRKQYVRFSVQIAVYFAVLFSYLIFSLPLVFKQIGPWMFVLSGATSLILITLFLLLLKRIVPEVVRRDRTKVAQTIAVIFLTFNVLYFTNLIPPLPLSLKEGGVYHRVTKVGTEYHLLAEPIPWYKKYLAYNTVYHRSSGESVYVYSAIFAPTGLSTVVVHQWQRYDTASKSWITADTLRFTINGGRDGGYRGYSIKSDIAEGKWRVNVLTQYGQTIGRITFTVADVDIPAPAHEIVY